MFHNAYAFEQQPILKRVNDNRYERFSDEVCHWENMASFLSDSDWIDAIHVIRLRDGSSLDILIRGGIRNYDSSRALPIFFNGAVDRAKGQPPFFSGSSIAKELRTPVVAIADPTISPSNNLGIGWYTGHPNSGAQDAITQLLRSLADRFLLRLVLVGGSAGGFASLYYAARIGQSAFVWNPQVDLLRYAPAHVREYLSAVLSDGSWAQGITAVVRETPPIDYELAASGLTSNHIDFRLEDTSPISRLLYLQNVSDTHENSHARPLRERENFNTIGSGLYQSGTRIMAVGNFADSHRAPSREVIRDGILAVMDQKNDLVQTATALLAQID